MAANRYCPHLNQPPPAECDPQDHPVEPNRRHYQYIDVSLKIPDPRLNTEAKRLLLAKAIVEAYQQIHAGDDPTIVQAGLPWVRVQ